MDSVRTQSLLPSPYFGMARVALGKLRYWHYRLFRQRPIALERIDGMATLVLPGVLNPSSMRTGEFFAGQLGAALVKPEMSVLDMGTGSGVCAVAAARHARRVVAVDINPAAVRCARINSLLNSLEQRIEVLQGDLFAPLHGQRFDLVLLNPPFIRAAARDDADRAWRSLDLGRRFAAGLADHLTPDGSALVLLSTYGDPQHFVDEFRAHGFSLKVAAERAYINEKLTLLRLRPQRTAAPQSDT